VLLHPRVDGGIPLDSAIESQQFRSHRRPTFSRFILPLLNPSELKEPHQYWLEVLCKTPDPLFACLMLRALVARWIFSDGQKRNTNRCMRVNRNIVVHVPGRNVKYFTVVTSILIVQKLLGCGYDEHSLNSWAAENTAFN
jgi:hypothetical protein